MVDALHNIVDEYDTAVAKRARFSSPSEASTRCSWSGTVDAVVDRGALTLTTVRCKGSGRRRLGGKTLVVPTLAGRAALAEALAARGSCATRRGGGPAEGGPCSHYEHWSRRQRDRELMDLDADGCEPPVEISPLLDLGRRLTPQEEDILLAWRRGAHARSLLK